MILWCLEEVVINNEQNYGSWHLGCPFFSSLALDIQVFSAVTNTVY